MLIIIGGTITCDRQTGFIWSAKAEPFGFASGKCQGFESLGSISPRLFLALFWLKKCQNPFSSKGYTDIWQALHTFKNTKFNQ
jgi:hypothetical protein